MVCNHSAYRNYRVKRRAGGAAEITSGATEGLNQSRRILMETVQRSSETIGRLGMDKSWSNGLRL